MQRVSGVTHVPWATALCWGQALWETRARPGQARPHQASHQDQGQGKPRHGTMRWCTGLHGCLSHSQWVWDGCPHPPEPRGLWWHQCGARVGWESWGSSRPVCGNQCTRRPPHTVNAHRDGESGTLLHGPQTPAHAGPQGKPNPRREGTEGTMSLPVPPDPASGTGQPVLLPHRSHRRMVPKSPRPRLTGFKHQTQSASRCPQQTPPSQGDP